MYNKFIQIKKTKNGTQDYYYAERLGIDSVAFILGTKQINGKFIEFVVNHEFKPPVNRFLNTAFGGSIDKNGITLKRLVAEEVYEEAGVSVTESAIMTIGSYFVSTQMNQFCHLYFVHAVNPYTMPTMTDYFEFKPTTKDQHESKNVPVRVTKEDILASNDWKSIVILTKLIERGLA